MDGFKRNQAVEAISVTVGQGLPPSAPLQIKLKRLLDTDRNLGRRPRSKDPQWTRYAFYGGTAPGRGSEVVFSGYEVFALLEASNLMKHGWPQATAVSFLRQLRPTLEAKHAEMLQWNPADLFDEQKILEAAQPGALAVWSTRPVFLVIASRRGSPVQQSSDDKHVAILEHDKLMSLFREQPGLHVTMTELTRTAHLLHDALAKTKPSKRGKGSS